MFGRNKPRNNLEWQATKIGELVNELDMAYRHRIESDHKHHDAIDDLERRLEKANARFRALESRDGIREEVLRVRTGQLSRMIAKEEGAEIARKKRERIAALPEYTEEWTCPKCGHGGPHMSAYDPALNEVAGVCKNCEFVRPMRPLDWKDESDALP